MADINEESPLAGMTWLEAAEYVLSQEGPEMHIRDITDRVMKLRVVKSSCKTSLETLLYRQTHKPNSKFQRVPGKMGWFKLTSTTTESGLLPTIYHHNEDEVTPKSVIVRPRKRCHDDSGDSADTERSSDSGNDDSVEWMVRYKYLKKLAKRMIVTNAGLALNLQELEEEIEKRKEEKRYLYKRLLDLQTNQSKPSERPHNNKQPETPPTTGKTRKPRLIAPPPPKTITTPTNNIPISHTKTTPTATDRLIYNEIIEPSDIFSTSSSNNSEDEGGREGEGEEIVITKPLHSSSNTSASNKRTPRGQREETGGGGGDKGGSGRKKRVRRLQPILMKDDGTPVFPIKLGGLQVHSLGKVVWDRPTFHNERYIWPLGFKSTRSYPSMLEPARRCLYTCHILDGKDGPIFEMVSEESPDTPIRASSATACHHTVLKAINTARDKQATNAGSGPEFFGFSHPSILNLIQTLPNAEKCTKYKPTQFQQPLSRGKAPGGTSNPTNTVSNRKPKTKPKLKQQPLTPAVVVRGSTPSIITNADPSLAPVNNQLTSLNEFSDSLSSDSSDCETPSSHLIIDNTQFN